jgi:hypothetical protein
MRNIKPSFEKYCKTSGMKLVRDEKNSAQVKSVFVFQLPKTKENATCPMED